MFLKTCSRQLYRSCYPNPTIIVSLSHLYIIVYLWPRVVPVRRSLWFRRISKRAQVSECAVKPLQTLWMIIFVYFCILELCRRWQSTSGSWLLPFCEHHLRPDVPRAKLLHSTSNVFTTNMLLDGVTPASPSVIVIFIYLQIPPTELTCTVWLVDHAWHTFFFFFFFFFGSISITKFLFDVTGFWYPYCVWSEKNQAFPLFEKYR